MKKLKLAINMMAFSLLVFTGNRLAAFPLTLTSIKGVIVTTPHYGVDATTTSNVASQVSVTLNHVINVLSNEVFLDVGTNPPAEMQIALDPYTRGLYLTNDSGFFYNIKSKGFGNFQIRDVATTYNTNKNFEQDVMVIDLGFQGQEPNGQSFQFDLRGAATFKFMLNPAGVGAINLSSSSATGYGEINSSDSGVSIGSFKAVGAGVPEWAGPFSVYWFNN